MSESRDRLARPIDISTLLPNAARKVNLMVDEPGLSLGLIGTPVRHRSDPGAETGAASGGLIGGRAGSLVAGFGGGRRLGRTPIAREISLRRTVRGGRARQRSVLPSWYPRTPLRDITAVVRAIDRRRAQVNDAQEQRVAQQPTYTPSSTAQFEQGISLATPISVAVKKEPQSSPASRVWRIVSRIADENVEDGSMMPQRKLLNSIEKVREAWLDEQRKVERAPSAKKADREQKVRVLMSMR